MYDRTALSIIAVVAIVVMCGIIVGEVVGYRSDNSRASQESAASSTVVAFGRLLQQVSLLAPNASSTIATTYAPYVDPALLAQWEADPTSAPGRVVSSPWPDHIQVSSVTPQGAGYIVDGDIVFMTSNSVEHGGNDGIAPIVIQLVNESGTWMIVAFQGQNQAD